MQQADTASAGGYTLRTQRSPDKVTNRKLPEIPKMKRISNRYHRWKCCLPPLTKYI
ncbi:Hypothetical protein SMAX5B_006484 [Scophthalmus maximus]|uniref:Uncharacterized protein n=1 Tax=Scophthalmus maximus TaxID=52904 RepID=A0A2U9BI72_SCOMX|nr:Hypothetical protein SMAX5B_006484 [Scophthalmus maximus]